MRKAYSYIRFSSPEQARGDSLRRQTEGAEKWCAERGITLDETLHDLGVSAYRGANRMEGALRSFLDLVERGEVEEGSYLIVESLDRLSREAVIDAVPRFLDLIRAGITIVTLSDNQEYSDEKIRGDWTALIVSLAIMSRAHEESKLKADRVAKAWRRKKDEARNERRPLTPRCPEWLEVRDGKFVEREERVDLVKRIFQETIDGFGRREIMRRLNVEGEPTFRGGKGWHTSSIAKVIQSRAVLGEYQPHVGTHKNRNRKPDGEPITDYYPRIIDDDTFWRAQNATAGRRQSAAGRKGQKGAHILQGLARCASCGGPMHIQNKGKPPKGGIYLVCSGNLRKTGCDNTRRIRVDRLERDLLTALLHVDVAALASLDDETPEMLRQIEALKAKLADAKARRTRLLTVLVTEDEEVQEQFVQVAAEVKELTKRLKEQEKAAASRQADPGIIARLTTANELSGQLEETDLEKRRELRIKLSSLLRGLVERVDCRPIGPVMILKPRLEVQMKGVMPFAFRMDHGIVSMLLESPANNDALDQFFLGLGGASGME
ncbi:recombinase family protein [Agrobacterium sp. NPDC089420]|uniref:recombinase family protein n=1 Tax=Agrobacterium sp. NPDC089420 TaxID=3363918 RepID=UPI00384A86A8